MLQENEREGARRISMAEYISDPCPTPSLSRTVIKTLINETPAKVWHQNSRLNLSYVPDVNSKYDMGSICHSLFLEGIDIAEVIVADDWRKNATKDAANAARTKGKIPLLEKHYDQALKVVTSAQRHLAESELGITDLQKEGDSELSYFWQENGIWLRIRPDWISKDRWIIIDTKFTGLSASPASFDRLVLSMGYDIQSALYARGIRHIEKTEPKFIFFVCEVEEPYLCSLISLDPQYLDMADRKVEMGIGLWKKHLESNEWPGYSNRIHYVEPKPWVMAQWEERQFADGLAETGTDPTEKWSDK